MEDKRTKETLCWSCRNACGGCSWSSRFEPVKDWKAQETLYGMTGTNGRYVKKHTYRVISCPKFEQDERSGAEE